MDTDGIHHGPVTLHNQTMQTEGAVVALTGLPPCVVKDADTSDYRRTAHPTSCVPGSGTSRRASSSSAPVSGRSCDDTGMRSSGCAYAPPKAR